MENKRHPFKYHEYSSYAGEVMMAKKPTTVDIDQTKNYISAKTYSDRNVKNNSSVANDLSSRSVTTQKTDKLSVLATTRPPKIDDATN